MFHSVTIYLDPTVISLFCGFVANSQVDTNSGGSRILVGDATTREFTSSSQMSGIFYTFLEGNGVVPVTDFTINQGKSLTSVTCCYCKCIAIFV